ncbi:MAG: hypothetical protein WD097_05440 [Balneolales bacterium]
MTTRDEVNQFLRTFKAKLKVYDIIFTDDRAKNTQALLDLEITPDDRKKVLEQLEVTGYVEGPLDETMYGGGAMWVFGSVIKGKEIYIKITQGMANGPVICISFHSSEHDLNYPFR